MLGFERRAGSNQARLQWQGTAPVYNEEHKLEDAMPELDDEAAVSGHSTDDAAMAAADNMDWNFM